MAQVEVTLYRLDVPADEEARLAGWLSPAEQQRAAAFPQPTHRRRFVVRRGRLRQWLGAQLGLAPGDVVLASDAMGKPHVPGWAGHFSASHSGERMALALADAPVGCDIEAVQPDFPWADIARHLFAPEEWQALAALPPPEGRQGFFRCWARKEAFVKGLGLGLSHPLDSFAVSCGAEAQLLRGGEGWALAGCDLGEGALAGPAALAVAVAGPLAGWRLVEADGA